MYSIKLADGTKLENLELNGNNFIASTTIDDEVFEDNLGKITITDEEGNTEEYKDMKIIKNQPIDGKSWLVFKQKTEKEALQQQTKSMQEEIDRLQNLLVERKIITEEDRMSVKLVEEEKR